MRLPRAVPKYLPYYFLMSFAPSPSNIDPSVFRVVLDNTSELPNSENLYLPTCCLVCILQRAIFDIGLLYFFFYFFFFFQSSLLNTSQPMRYFLPKRPLLPQRRPSKIPQMILPHIPPVEAPRQDPIHILDPYRV